MQELPLEQAVEVGAFAAELPAITTAVSPLSSTTLLRSLLCWLLPTDVTATDAVAPLADITAGNQSRMWRIPNRSKEGVTTPRFEGSGQGRRLEK